MGTVVIALLCYFFLGVLMAHVVHNYEDLDTREHDGVILCACFFWPVFIIGYIFVLPCRFFRYCRTKIISAKKVVKNEYFQEAINLIETLPIDSFEEHNGALYLREKEGSPVCKDWLLFHKERDSWHVSFCYTHFYIPDSIFFGKYVDVLEKKVKEYETFEKIEKYGKIENVRKSGKTGYQEIADIIRENAFS